MKPKTYTRMTRLTCASRFIAAFVAAMSLTPSFAATPATLLGELTAQAGVAPNPERGRQFFVSRHGQEWSCATCHGELPTGTGKHASTGKQISPLAPAFNGDRFTDGAKAEKWFRRNCRDVTGRECTPAEKADVLSWLLTLKP